MTLKTNARLAGTAFLLYIGSGIAGMVVSGQATRGADPAAKLASIASHLPQMRLGITLTMIGMLCAIVLGVTLYALTRNDDPDLAMFGLAFRISEGAVSTIPLIVNLTILSLATAKTITASHIATATMLFQIRGTVTIAATLFALGSTAFSLVFLRARTLPASLAWLGVLSSISLVIGVPLNGLGLMGSTAMWTLWMPMLVFEVWFAVYLIVKGVRRRGEGRPPAPETE